MLYTINRGNVRGFTGGQRSIIYCVSTVEAVDGVRPWVFTDGHGTMRITQFFSDLNDLDEVDWDVMESQYWYDTEIHPDRRRRRQAEFLVYEYFPMNLISHIGVYDSAISESIITITRNAGYNIPVWQRPNWDY